MRIPTLFVALVFAAVLPWSGLAEQQQQQQKPETSTEEDSTAPFEPPAIRTTHLFPDNPFQMVVNGEVVPLLLGLRHLGKPVSDEKDNKGQGSVTVLGIDTSFTNPTDFEKIVRNVTRMNYYATLSPGQETTINYRFKTDFEPGDIGMVVHVELANDRSQKFSVVAFKGVVKVADPVQTLDLQMIFVYIVVGALLVGVGSLAKTAFFGGSTSQSKKRRVSADVKSAAADSKSSSGAADISQWIPEQHLKQLGSPKAGSKKRK